MIRLNFVWTLRNTNPDWAGIFPIFNNAVGWFFNFQSGKAGVRGLTLVEGLDGYRVPRQVFARAMRIILSLKESLSCSKNSLLFLRPQEQPEPLSIPSEGSSLTGCCGIWGCAVIPAGFRCRSRIGFLGEVKQKAALCWADLAGIPQFSSQTQQLLHGFHGATQAGSSACLFGFFCN